jgi:nucleoside-diphosphate-sugar epimerase
MDVEPLPFLHLDLEAPGGADPTPSGLLVSFAPIWSFAPWLARCASMDPSGVAGLQGVIACSSSSVITKRFAANGFDRELVRRLGRAEDQLTRTCAAHRLPLRILAPTLIYGQAGPLGDRNLSKLRGLLRRLPVLPLPGEGGLRQPIHCRQLAAVALHLADTLTTGEHDPSQPIHLPLGGDDTISYATMLRRLQQATPPEDPARRCRLAALPPRLFHTLAAPLLPLSPKNFEAVLRISADLAGFTPAHRILGRPPEPFPVPPLTP